MSKYTNTIEYKLKTSADLAGLTKLQNQIRAVQTEFTKISLNSDIVNADKINNVVNNLTKLQNALRSSMNMNLGTIDVSKFNASLEKSQMNLASLKSTLMQCGIVGQQSFNDLISTIGTLDTKVRTTSSAVDKVFNTISNTVRWGIVASGFETVSNSIARSVQYFRDLDKSLNDIRIVTGQSSEDMRNFAQYASEAAASLGKTTVEFTNASLIFAQQGYSQQRANELGALTLKTANVTGQDTAEVSEQLTSLINGFQLQNENIQTIEAQVDKLAKVAATGGADLEELATAESKVASTANTLGVTQDQLVSQLSTIISVTRQAPGIIGYILLIA